MRDMSERPLVEIVAELRAQLAAGARELSLLVLDPDRGRGRFAGERVVLGGRAHIHRPFRVWVDLAERLGLRLLTPRAHGEHLVELRMERLDAAATLAASAGDPEEDAARERYGAGSLFSRISRLDDPGLILDLADALERAGTTADARVLALGVNRGDELALLEALVPGLAERGSFVGVDHSASALARARERFADPRHQFIEADLADLAVLGLGDFDLVIAISTLQSPGVDDRALLRAVVHDHLRPGGALLLGIPNCRYVDGEQVHGARMKNFSQPELSLVIKEIAFYRRYLQQHRFQVFVTGKSYLLVTAVPRRG
ncbi:MAG: class I SAM-dependent methyltransferase [Myxococcales bacterium]|nr:class I SAM-dependent methyltransferase [Myxococcales bacterium]